MPWQDNDLLERFDALPESAVSDFDLLDRFDALPDKPISPFVGPGRKLKPGREPMGMLEATKHLVGDPMTAPIRLAMEPEKAKEAVQAFDPRRVIARGRVAGRNWWETRPRHAKMMDVLFEATNVVDAFLPTKFAVRQMAKEVPEIIGERIARETAEKAERDLAEIALRKAEKMAAKPPELPPPRIKPKPTVEPEVPKAAPKAPEPMKEIPKPKPKGAEALELKKKLKPEPEVPKKAEIPTPEKPPKPEKPISPKVETPPKAEKLEMPKLAKRAKELAEKPKKEIPGFDDDRFAREMDRIGSWGMSAPNKKFMSYKLLEPEKGKFQVERTIAGDREIIVGQRGSAFGTHEEAVTWARFDAKKRWNEAAGWKPEGPPIEEVPKPKIHPPEPKPEVEKAKTPAAQAEDTARKIEKRIKWDLIPAKKMTPAQASKAMLKVYGEAQTAIKKYIRPEHQKKIYQPAFGEKGSWRVDMSSPMYEETEILVKGAPTKVTFDVAGAGRYEVHTAALPYFEKRLKPATKSGFFKTKLPMEKLPGPGTVSIKDLEAGEIVPLPKFQKAITKLEKLFQEVLGGRPEARYLKTVKDFRDASWKEVPDEVKGELSDLYLELGEAHRNWLQASTGKIPSKEAVEEAKEASVNRIIELIKSEKGEAQILTDIAAGALKGAKGAAARGEAIKHGKWFRGALDEPEMVRAVEDIVTTGDRTYRSMRAHEEAIATQWEKAATASRAGSTSKAERLLEDVGAVQEGIGNINIKGDTVAAARERLGPVGKKILKQYQDNIERVRTQINDYLKEVEEDEYINHLDNYLAHFYTGSKKTLDKVRSRLLKHSPNARQRKLPTLAEAIQEGLTPVSQNVAKLHKMYSELNWRVATTRHMLADLANVTATDGMPIIVKATTATPAGWKRINHPAFEKLYSKMVAERGDTRIVQLWKGGVKIHPEAYPAVQKLLNEQFSSRFVRSVEEFNAWSKQAMLSFSLFHHAALTESAQAVLARGRNPFRGFVLLKEMDPILEKKVITMPHRVGVRLVEEPEFLKDAIGHGLVVGPMSDIPVQRVTRRLMNLEARTRNIPVVRHLTRAARRFKEGWDKRLWDHYHTGLKGFAYYDLTAELMKKFPKVAPDEIKQKVATHLNDAFGGQEWLTKFWLEPKAQQMLHMAMLAPDWTLSNINIAGKTILAAKDPVMRTLNTRYWRNMIPTLIGSAAAISYGIYAAFGDESKGDKAWMFDNEKGHKFDIDVTPLMRQLPWWKKEAAEGQRYYLHFGKQAREVLRWAANPLEAATRKASPAVHVAFEQVTGMETGGFETKFKNLDFWDPEGLKERAVSIGEKFWPFSFRANNFAFAAPLRKGMTYWKARKAYESALELYAEPSLLKQIAREGPEGAIRFAHTPEFTKRLNELVGDIHDAARRNNVDTKRAFNRAVANIRGRYYGEFLRALESGKETQMEKAALAVIRLNAGVKNIFESAKDRGIDLTPEQKKEIRNVLKKKRAELYEW